MSSRHLIAPWLVILFMAGCREATPADFAVRLGESGGFTGWTTGYLLTPTGEVLEFSDRRQGEVVQRAVGRLSAEQRDELWRRFSTSVAFETPPVDERGDLTRFLEMVANGERRRVEWTVGPRHDPPPPAVALFDHCRDVLTGATLGASGDS